MQNGSNRDQFSSQWGFILACIGSAVGMGNIWLFPFRVGQFGGAAFLIPYILFVREEEKKREKEEKRGKDTENIIK